MTKYLIDTNSLIDAKDFFYAFDICPGFWNALLRHHASGEVFSIDQVRDELIDGNVVCEEQFNPSAQKRVPNPNVCRQFGVSYCNVFEMLRRLHVKFGLKKLNP